jgi:PDZ domain-containing protein
MRILMLVLVLFLAELGGVLAAQMAQACALSPGVRYGIRAFSCASCTLRQAEPGALTTYTFLSEPIVTETEPGSAFAPGDIIAAVDSLPITTQAGADRFTSPADGRHTVTVRNGNDRRDVVMQLSGRCRAGSGAPLDTVRRGNELVVIDTSVHAGYGSGHGGGRGVGVPVLGGAQMVIVNGRPVQAPAGASPVGRFGFATECRPSCSTKQSAAGHYVFVYDGYPVVADVRPGSAAAAGGLRVGDEIVAINGRSVLADNALEGTDRDDLHLLVRRGGKQVAITMRVKK